MSNNISVKILNVDGMSCINCETKIQNELKKIDGVLSIKASYSDSNVKIAYNNNKVKIVTIINTIEKYGYSVIDIFKESEVSSNNKNINKFTDRIKISEINQLIGIGFILLAAYLLVNNTIGFNFIPNIDKSVGYSALFVIGILTSLHCVAMCGGINLSVCSSYKFDSKDKAAKFKPSFLYNFGRIISYTIIGGIVGLLGSILSFSNSTKSMLIIFSGIFMIIMGLNMISIFPWLRKINPRMPKVFSRKITEHKNNRGPFFVGLLNGLMPCGPLQAMQLYALGTGSIFAGAFSMFLFSLGTVPLMFGLGALSSFLSNKYTKKMLKVSAVLVMMLGIIMINRGFRLSGISIFAANPTVYSSNTKNITSSVDKASNSDSTNSRAILNIAKIENGVQTVTAKLENGLYPSIIVQKGIPVKFILKADASNLTGCNSSIVIPDFNVQKNLAAGSNTIEFTPNKTGDILYTCWMGMVTGNIKVVDNIKNLSKNDVKLNKSVQYQQNSGGMSCCSRP